MLGFQEEPHLSEDAVEAGLLDTFESYVDGQAI